MSVVRLDSMGKLEIPGGQPGELYRIEQLSPGKFLIERIEESEQKKTAEEVIAAMKGNPLTPRMSWEELRATTRELRSCPIWSVRG